MAWKVSGRRGLPIRKQSSWPSSAKSKTLNKFKKEGGGYKAAAKGAFLLHDPSKADTQAGYKLPFAVVSGGKVVAASSAGLAAAARRLPQVSGVPSGTMASARKVIDSYQKKKIKEYDMKDVGKAFTKRFKLSSKGKEGAKKSMKVSEVFDDHVIVNKNGSFFKVPYTSSENEVTFSGTADWQQMKRTYSPVKVKESASGMDELGQDLSSFSRDIRAAFNARFKLKQNNVYDSDSYGGYMYVEGIFVDHPTLNNSIIVDKDGGYWQVSYEATDEGITFAGTDDWIRVLRTYIPAGEPAPKADTDVDDKGEEEVVEFGESEVGAVLGLIEDDSHGGPLQLNVAVIEPGWGNTRDNNYYPSSVLKRDAKVFEGAKMYATNHKQSEKSVLTEVSQVLECPTGFTESGAPIARVGVFNEQFAESIRNRDALGVLSDLHCSIVAGGRVEKGFTANGRKGKKVVAITEAVSVDWVTRHGAGGRALSMVEGDDTLLEESMNEHDDVIDVEAEESEVEEAAFVEDETPATTDDVEDAHDDDEDADGDKEPDDDKESDDDSDDDDGDADTAEEQFLTEADVSEIVGEVKNLPDPTSQRLLEGTYHNRYEVISAIEAEQSYLKMITGSGKPPKMGGSSQGSTEPVSEDEVLTEKNKVNSKYLPGLQG